MKNSFKIAAIALAFAAATFSAKAQTAATSASASTTSNGVRFSIGVDAGIPTGNLSNAYNWNIGGSVQADIPIVNQLFVTVNAGYNNFIGKSDLIVPDVAFGQTGGAKASVNNLQFLPVKAGLKFFPVNNFYIQGEAGVAFALNKSDADFDKSAAFIYAPQIGYQFQLGGGNYIDAGVRYEASTKFNSDIDDSKVSFVGLRVAYGF